jgi:diguanylate cyclase (GGDEF)-like protein/PAS domain S-box-containing protein
MQKSRLMEELENWRLAARRFESLFQRLPIPCLGFDLEGTIFEWNTACEAALGGASAILFMAPLHSVFCHDDAQREELDRILESLARGESTDSLPWVLEGLDGSLRHLLLNIIPTSGQEATYGGGVLVWTDVTELKAYEQQIESQLFQIHEYSVELEVQRQELEAANRQLSALAFTDGLTGLANHRSFQEALRREVAELGQTVSLILLDVDHFKYYNDTFGHPQGDLVLKAVGDCLLKNTTNEALVARYGGEEFAILLPRANHGEALEIAEAMRSVIAAYEFPKSRVTASFGVATLDDSSRVPEMLIHLADQALYLSKFRGRNCVSSATELDQEAA